MGGAGGFGEEGTREVSDEAECLPDRIIAFLSRHKKEGAIWTSDIAAAVRQPTAKVRRALFTLALQGVVERVVMGNPSSWRIVQNG